MAPVPPLATPMLCVATRGILSAFTQIDSIQNRSIWHRCSLNRTLLECLGPVATERLRTGPYLQIYFRGEGFDINIHYRYSKVFKVIFYEVVYAILTLSGFNIAMLVKFLFFVTATAV